MKKILFSLVASMLLAACSTEPDDLLEKKIETTSDNVNAKAAMAAAESVTFANSVSLGVVNNNAINEASGLAGSLVYPDMLWTHNDSGDRARIFLIDENAQHKATINFSTIRNRDWEDIAVGPGPVEGKSYVYIGEIGDNAGTQRVKTIYRIVEPELSIPATGTVTKTISSGVDAIRFELSDGPRDAEAFVIDAVTKNIYVISKREPRRVNLYVLPYPQSTTAINIAQFVRTIPFTQIVAADMSPDGQEILIKSYGSVYYWRKGENEPLEAVFDRSPYRPPYTAERQGEAIAFDVEGEGYYTLSEGTTDQSAPLLFYKRN